MTEIQKIRQEIAAQEAMLATAKQLHDWDCCGAIHQELSRLYRVMVLVLAEQTEQEMMKGN